MSVSVKKGEHMTSIDKLREFLPDRHTAALVTSDINIRYFTLFPDSEGALLVTSDACWLLVDFRYYEKAQGVVSDEITLVQFKKLFDSINSILEKRDIKRLLIEEEEVTLSRFEKFKSELHAELLTEYKLSKIISDIRVIKTDREIELLTQAQRIAEKAYTEVLNYIKPGVEERKIALELEYLMKQYGAERIAFDFITVSGKKTSMPHGSPDRNIIREGDFFTSDIGAVYEGYHSDMTRTVAVSYATDQMREIYDIVLKAHEKAAQKIVVGNTTADVDLAARDYITEKGYGEYFGHSTGHGVGLVIHEAPTVYKAYDTVLRHNMVITDEPGIYLPSEFGVRIEDMYVVRDEGSYTLAEIDKNLIIV